MRSSASQSFTRRSRTWTVSGAIFNVQPNTRLAVLVFGLFHGLGLATKLQDFSLAREGLVANLVSFNVGVEIGQVLALTVILIAFT